MEGIDSGSTDNSMRGSNLENSLSNVAEQMNFDAYAGWCNSQRSLADQMLPSFVSTNLSPIDGLNFTHQYSSGIPILDGDVIESSSISANCQFHCATNCADDGYNLNETRDKSLSQPNNIAGIVRSNVITRPPMQSLAEKILTALDLFKQSSGGGILAQVWVPVPSGDRYILSTCEQPYLLDQTLYGYREVSRSFTFATETRPGCFLGLPGRVFATKKAEWTSNVMYYNRSEYLRVQHAADHEVRGSIALPVFADDSVERSCCAVLELVTMGEKSNFDLEMENVCRALEAVNLRSVAPPRLYHQNLSKNQMEALSDITDVLRVVCYTHRLPLALAWIPCSYTQGPRNGTNMLHARVCCSSLNSKCILCVEDTASYVNDKDMKGFVHACVEHYLEKGQGIVGKALQSNHPFFYADVKEYHITEYPLVHHARKYGLNAAVAVRLRSIYTGDNDYILEFFLPVDMRQSTEQQLLLNNLSSTMQRICKSLRTVSDTELKQIPATLLRETSKQSPITGNFNMIDSTNHNLSELTTTRVKDDVSLKQPLTILRKHTEKKPSTAEKHVNLSVLKQHFSGTLKDAAKSIGVCPTTLKKICRQHGISRWPSRKIHKVNRSLKKIQSVLDSVQGMEGGLKFDPTIEVLVAAGSMTQESDSRKDHVLPRENDHQLLKESDIVMHNAKYAPTSSYMDIETTMLRMEKECHVQNQEESRMASLDAGLSWPAGIADSSHVSGSGSMMNSSSSSSGEKQNYRIETSDGDSGSKLIVKATYKEDTIRFKFEPAAGSIHLYEQVARRFKLQMGEFQLKYLDDEEEWVMLVSDLDLQECLEVLDFLGTRNVKFLVRDVPSAIGSSSGSNPFLGEGS
ncbi:hypothetical protein OROHE_002929 [Orobanche hederae]